MFRRIVLAFLFLLCFVGVCSCSEKNSQNTLSSKKSENTLDAFMCADDGNAMQTSVVIASLLSTTASDKINLNIVYFENNPMSQENKDKLLSLKKIKDYNLNFIPFNKEKLAEFDTEFWNPSIMIKLFAAEIFKDLQKIIWLDDDLVIREDLGTLFDKDLTGKYIIGADFSKIATDAGTKCDYWITAALALYNLEEIRKNNVQEEFLKVAREYSKNAKEVREKNPVPGGIEEFVLSKVVSKDKALFLGENKLVITADENLVQYFDNVAAVHFTSPGKKPWIKENKDNLNQRYYDEWHKYYKMTPYYK